MKKFAFILMGSSYNTDMQKTRFDTENGITDIFTVNNFDEAEKKIKDLVEKGYGCVELCGAFGRERVLDLIDKTDNKIAIGYVVHEPSQDDLFASFWAN